MIRADVAIVGAGMAGASLAAELAPHASVVVLEAEDQPGYHSTGRSAAFWSESYGGPFVQPLTTASGPFLREHGFLKTRGALHLAEADGVAKLAELRAQLGATVRLEPIQRPQLEELVPGLRDGWHQGLLEPTCADIDVAALHGFYLAASRRAGAGVMSRARLLSAERRPGRWILATEAGPVEAELFVNAGGAWADEVAGLTGAGPLGIQPYRRTIAQLRIDPPAPPELPLVIDASGRFYFKPEAGGRLWLSPHDETRCVPSDCAPDEYDVALAIDRLDRVVDWRVDRVERRWAGLRSFAPDRLPVFGFDSRREGFFWFAGQGGFGIQTAPAAAKLGAALLLGRQPELDPEPYRPERFAN